MMFTSMTLGFLLTSVNGLMNPEQVLNIDHSVASLRPSLERSTSSQVQTVLRSQTPSSTALHISTTSHGAKKGAWMDKRGAFVIPSAYGEKKLRQLYQSGDVMATTADLLTPTTTQSSQIATTSSSTNDPPASSNGPFTSAATQNSQIAASQPLTTDPLGSSSGIITPTATQSSRIATTSPLTTDPPASSNSIPLSTHGNTNTPDVQSQNTVSIPGPAKGSSATPRPSTTTNMADIQNAKSNIAPVHSNIISSPFSAIASKPDLTPSTGTITANSKSQASSPFSQALAFDSTILVAAKPASSKIPPLLTIGGKTVTANSLSQYNIDGQILTPGGIVTVSSTVISLASDDIEAIIGTKTEVLHPYSAGGFRSEPAATSRPGLILGTQTLTSNSLGQYNIDGQTLTPGNAITISGTTVSLAPDGSDVVVGTKTEALGASITAGLHPSSNGTAVQGFQGKALGVGDRLWSSMMVVLAGFAVPLWLWL